MELGMSETIRAFVAIKVSPLASDVLVATRKRLTVALQPRVVEGIRWENAGYHVTLRFLADITRAQAQQLLWAGPITTPRPVQTRVRLSLGPLGVFPAAGGRRWSGPASAGTSKGCGWPSVEWRKRLKS